MPKPSPLLIEAAYRNDFEKELADQLEANRVLFTYESLKLAVNYPPRTGRYTPDLIPDKCNIIIEAKGRFGGPGGQDAGVKERQKIILAKEQHPELDFRLVFMNPNLKIYKGSKTTYAKWADDHGFKWAKRVIPDEWIKEIKQQQKEAKHVNGSRKAIPRQRPAPRTTGAKGARALA